MRILIADDDPLALKATTHIMKQFGEVISVSGGQEAVDAFIRAWDDWRPFRLVALDIEMPDLGGRDALQEIRELEAAKNIPKEEQVKIIAITANSQVDQVLELIQSGCNDFVVKPASKDTITAKLQKLNLLTP